MKNPIDGWTNVLSHERNELVFEKRNRAYGAYQIRIEYVRTLLIALLSTVCGFLLLAILIPAALESLQPSLKNLNLTEINQIFNLSPTLNPSVDVPKQNQKPAQPIPKPPVDNIAQEHYRPVVTDHSLTPETASPVVTTDQTPATNPLAQPGLDPSALQGGPAVGPGTGPNLGAEPNRDPLLISEIPPSYIGGEEAMNTFLANHIEFLSEYRDMGISGKAYISFVVETDGSISNVKAEKGIPGGKGLTDQAINAVKKMRKWKPGEQNGKFVRVRMVIPVWFSLNK